MMEALLSEAYRLSVPSNARPNGSPDMLVTKSEPTPSGVNFSMLPLPVIQL